MSTQIDTPEQAEFREHCRSWLAENRPSAPPFRIPLTPIEIETREQIEWFRAWQKACYEAGLVGTDYPKEYGGHGHTGCQSVATQEMAKADVPYLCNVVGLSMAAPTILNHGTEWQRKRFIGPILSGEEIWCQGFSEPGAGSDMANIQTSAVRDGDNWVVNGHKVWTSLAHFASHMILVARHSSDHKHKGLTYFLCPVADTKGVEVRPLIKLTGETGFNEVLLEDVVFPDTMRVDEIGNGWSVAMTTLMYERGAAEGAGSGGGVPLDDRVANLVTLAKETPRHGKTAWDDAVLRDRIMNLAVRVEGFTQMMRRSGVGSLTEDPMRLPMQAKVLVSELMQDIPALGMEIAGPRASLYIGDEAAPLDGYWPHAYMDSFGFTIAAGSNEIQRNLLGERILGMPKTK
jgi:alkylation response protein AidB-like acyl-CoA dehydrogenase